MNADVIKQQKEDYLARGVYNFPTPAYIEVTMRVPRGAKPMFEDKTVQALFDTSKFPDVRFYCREDFYPELEALILKVLNSNP